ncbi:MAG: winged helix-turn-helix transcriptional regulator [Synechococcaceae cyanobacterium SM2_3_1]|nr:winged helix-turn-helix transcriptional regulator [Synechococcaceae cyanobacterium SM2_3_1]
MDNLHQRIQFSPNYIQRLSRLLQLLGEETRLQIVLCLAQGEANVSELCEFLQLPQSTVSHHLGLLRLAELVVTRREGRQIYYSIHQQTWRTLASGFFDQLPPQAERSVQLDAYQITELQDSALGDKR